MIRRTFTWLLGLQGTYTTTAWACSCLPSSTEENFASASLAFVGQARGSGRATACNGGGPGFIEHWTEFEVTEGFKGVIEGDVVRVWHNASGATCGAAIARGDTWVVYTHPLDGEEVLGGCSSAPFTGPDASLDILRSLAP